ncbi:signal transduction histidine kinase [Microbacterium terrae]|uniref:histidine kinase n=1 Tax=Microbacterium terrae TaxID=69369 RepID=A0A0M2H261_9MICO|nr:sensor histidine kinase [Microbacterium terrae]KJL40502.1 Sensor histidine kinase DesK [Microbacterium terrae]MBP1079173.1 signal transduction histidine kinase [Microbacterium terrae]GLJ98574.1 two-component sensor histidine kinase [Microbacterium terrae]
MSFSTSTPALLRAPATARDFRNDIWLAGALLLGAILSAALGSTAGVYGGGSPALGWALLYSAGLTVPLALRRRHPEIVACTVAVVFFIGVSARIPELYVGNIALFIAFYTVGAWVDDRRRALYVRAAIIVGMFVWLMVTTFQSAIAPDDEGLSRDGLFSPFVAFMLIQFLVNVAFFGGAYYMGDHAYAAAIARTVLEERTRELELERELTAAQAVALDRVRIARELHDVVAHHVSAMGVQAGAARAVLERDPDAARTAMLGVEASARSALDELRHLLETLRTPGGGDGDSASTVHLSGLADLVAHANANGLPTQLTVVGEPSEPPEIVQVNTYRIAQEALTNARRHGGADARAEVRLRYEAGALELEVASTGRVGAAMRPGLGIVGMRERAAASGGTLEAGPHPRGGFLVRARMPLAAAVAS